MLYSLHSGKAIDSTLSSVAGAQILQWTAHSADNQKWQLEHLGSNQYKITSVFNGRVMDVAENSMINEGKIVTWTATGNNNQKFILESKGYNSYAIKSLSSGKYLDVLGPSYANGGLIGQFKYANGGLIGQFKGTNGENQTFLFLKKD